MPTLTADELAHFHESKQTSIITTSVVFLTLCNLSVLTRIVSQLRTSKKLFFDDYSIIFAAVCSDVIGALYLVATHSGLGLHAYRVLAEDPKPPQNLITLFRALYLNAVLTGPCFAAIKLALLWFYRRMFFLRQRWLEIAWWINLVYVIMWTLGSTLFYIFQCIPPDYYWERLYILEKIEPPSPVHGQCNSATAVLVALPLIFSLVSDFGILLLPIGALLPMNMPVSKKVGLTIIFSLGLLSCICEAIRIWLEVTISAFADPTYADVSFVIFTYAEGNIAIIAACAPFLAAQWKWSLTKVHTLLTSGSSRSRGRNGQNRAPYDNSDMTFKRDLVTFITVPDMMNDARHVDRNSHEEADVV